MISSLLSLLSYALPHTCTTAPHPTPPPILYLLQTQSGPHHRVVAARTEEFIVGQYQHQHADRPDIFWSHRDLRQPTAASSWAVFTISKAYFYTFL